MSKRRFLVFNYIQDLCEDIINLDSFNEMAMKLEISGNESMCDWILFDILCEKGLDFIREGWKPHRRLFEEYFDITDVLEQK